VETPNQHLHGKADNKWSHATVRTVLIHQEYCGDTVNFRRRKISYKSKYVENVPKEEWQIIENTHPAIIDRETFAKVQAMMDEKKRRYANRKQYPKALFHDVLFCADCGHRMYIMRRKTTGNAYICSHNRTKSTNCTPHYIKEEDLMHLVLSDLRYYFIQLDGSEKEFRAFHCVGFGSATTDCLGRCTNASPK